MKALTPIIGIILMLVLTLVIVGSAYVFLSGFYESSTSKTISLVTGSPHGRTALIQNLGTSTIHSTDLTVTVGGQDESFTLSPSSIPPGQASQINITSLLVYGNRLRVTVIGPTNPISYVTDIEAP